MYKFTDSQSAWEDFCDGIDLLQNVYVLRIKYYKIIFNSRNLKYCCPCFASDMCFCACNTKDDFRYFSVYYRQFDISSQSYTESTYMRPYRILYYFTVKINKSVCLFLNQLLFYFFFLFFSFHTFFLFFLLLIVIVQPV